MFSFVESFLFANLVLLGFVLDSLTTFFSLVIGGKEGNPFLSWWLTVENFWLLVVLKFFAFTALFFALYSGRKKKKFSWRWSFFVLTLLNIVYGFVVFNNFFQLAEVVL